MSLISRAPELYLNFPMTESGAPIGAITDTVQDNTLEAGGSVTIAEGSDSGINVQVYAFQDLTTKTIENPGALDWCLMTCFTAKEIGEDPYDNGSGSFYLSHIRLHPYGAFFFTTATGATTQIATPVYPAGLRRTTGQTYVLAAVKRGRYLEHWVDGVMVGRADTELILESVAMASGADATALQGLYNLWNDLTLLHGVTFGHSAFNALPNTYDVNGDPPEGMSEGAGGTWYPHLAESQVIPGFYELPGSWFTYDTYDGGVMDLAQDVYFARLLVFPEGIDGNVGQSMLWSKERALAGEKSVWPGWDAAVLKTTISVDLQETAP